MGLGGGERQPCYPIKYIPFEKHLLPFGPVGPRRVTTRIGLSVWAPEPLHSNMARVRATACHPGIWQGAGNIGHHLAISLGHGSGIQESVKSNRRWRRNSGLDGGYQFLLWSHCGILQDPFQALGQGNDSFLWADLSSLCTRTFP